MTSMTPRERLEAFWSGERPDRIPITIYEWLQMAVADDPAWQYLYENGLLVTYHQEPFAAITASGISYREVSDVRDGRKISRQVISTPVGEIYEEFLDGWRQKFLLCKAEDYRVMTYLTKHTEIKPRYEEYRQREKKVSNHGVLLPAAGRTPMQSIIVDLVGLENFALHLFDYQDEMMELYEALLEKLERRIEIIAEGPGRFVSILENFTAETLGPKRFEQFHLPVYQKYIPMLHEAGKIAGTHFDGQLASCAEVIGRTPIDLIESLTPPPEGDLTLAQARTAWPDKLFWSNISVANYMLPPAKLRETIARLVEEGTTADGRLLAFEVSEDLPANWKESIPFVMDVLREIAG